MSDRKYALIQELFIKWFPAIIILFILFMVPPAGIAIIIAYFTAPLLYAVRNVTRLPLTIATFIVMTLILFITGSFFYIALQGLMDIMPAIERQLTPLTGSMDPIGKTVDFLEDKLIQFGHALIEHAVTFIQTVFQQLFSLFIFIIAFFFSLRESGKDRFWFLVYFPKIMRKSAKSMLERASMLVTKFISVEIRLLFMTFIILSIGFIILDFTSPIGAAFLISLVDSLPFIGMSLVLIPMAAFFFYTHHVFEGIIILLLLVFTILTRQFAESYMYASTFQLKPVHAFFVMACSIYLFGIVGILLTPFLMFMALRVRNHSFFTSS